KEQISEMGSNMIMIHPGNMHRGGVRQSADDMQTLDESDYEALKDLPGIAAVSPSVNSGGQLVNGNNNYPSSIYGVTPEYLDIRRFKVKEGSIFTEHDIKSAAKVCILGKTVVDNLFPNGEDPVGRVIRFGKIPLTVIGVLESKGTNSMGQDQDDVVIAPYTTVMKRILAIDYIQGIFASAVDENRTDETIDAITEVLRTRHKIKEDADDDFEIRSQQELSEMMNSTSDMMTVLLACIAGISLLVGGIGIMNIMYVSVTERTREIGLRMSIGARGIDILSQFLIEAVIISVSGGVIGIMLGIIASWLVNAIAHWPVYIQAYSVVLSFAVCTVTGVFFGWYPAKKAAGLDPIEAIRYE
ncbi:ABC transporter permease, partial [uncultured Duncaniella sp.]